MSPAERDDDLRDTLRRAGLRATAPRLAALRAVRDQPHADVEEVAGRVRDALGRVSTQTVYDVLAALVRVGLVRRIEPAGSPSLYETRTGDNHHHIVCRDCGAVVDVDCAVGVAPCLFPSAVHGFDIDEAEVTFWGRCPDCRAAAPRTP